MREELDIRRLEQTLQRLNTLKLDLHMIKRPTPLGFPLLVERFRESISSEKLADRIRRMVNELEKLPITVTPDASALSRQPGRRRTLVAPGKSLVLARPGNPDGGRCSFRQGRRLSQPRATGAPRHHRQQHRRTGCIIGKPAVPTVDFSRGFSPRPRFSCARHLAGTFRLA